MRILKIYAHSRDCNSIEFPSGYEHNDYVPNGLGIGGGDDIVLDIDIDTGQIIGWNEKNTQAILDYDREHANSEDEDDEDY